MVGGRGNHSSANHGDKNALGLFKLGTGLPFALLGLSAWVIALAGVALMRHEVGENVLGERLSFSWWVIFFSLFVLLVALIHAAGSSLPHNIRKYAIGAAATTGLLAVSSALTMLETQRWYNARDVTTRGDRLGKGVRLAFAGFLAVSACQLILILLLGHEQQGPAYVQPAPVQTTMPVNNGMQTADTRVPQQVV